MRSLLLICIAGFFLYGCAVFQRKPKYGCPTSGAAVGAEKVFLPEKALQKKMRKDKYKGGNKFKYR